MGSGCMPESLIILASWSLMKSSSSLGELENPRQAGIVDVGYFGRTLGSPPGEPGGGTTGILPVSGVGA